MTFLVKLQLISTILILAWHFIHEISIFLSYCYDHDVLKYSFYS